MDFTSFYDQVNKIIIESKSINHTKIKFIELMYDLFNKLLAYKTIRIEELERENKTLQNKIQKLNSMNNQRTFI